MRTIKFRAWDKVAKEMLDMVTQELEKEIEDWRKEVKKWQMFFKEESQQNKLP